MTIRVLKEMPYAQAHIREYENEIYLISYTTLVAEIKADQDGNRWLKVNGLYSPTTKRHIMAFVKEYCEYNVDFYTIKTIVADKMAICLDTGELTEWEAYDQI